MPADAEILHTNPAVWLDWLSADFDGAGVDGLVPVNGYDRDRMRPEEVAIMEKAAHYEAQFVFFEARRNDRASAPQAFVYVSDGPADEAPFAALHKRLWSWGGVPLLYRKTPGKVDLLRCASKPDFDQKAGTPKYKPHDTFELIAEISTGLRAAQPWWDVARLRNGTLWDDPAVCNELLSDVASAHRHLVDNIFDLYKTIRKKGLLSEELQRRLLILSLLIAYLDERKALEPGYFALFLDSAKSFPDVLRDGPALVKLLGVLEDRFNGHVFSLDQFQREELTHSRQLGAFADLIQGHHDVRGQGSFWRLYSFRDLPVELISSIYQLFVEDKASSIYTPPALVRLMLEEALSWERIDRLIENDEVILDPACGSGVYLVEAYKRLILHWRVRNGWKRPKTGDLKVLLSRVHGIDLEPGAIKLAAFSLCLALCEALEPEHIRKSIKLFPILEGVTLHGKCFFTAREDGLVSARVGVVVGNPPFKEQLSTLGAVRAAARYQEETGIELPAKQLAYLFLINAIELLAKGGVMSMVQPAGLIYNLNSSNMRHRFFNEWDVREVLDFVSIRGLFGDADTKVVIIVAIAEGMDPSRKLLHAIFRRSGKAETSQGYNIDYYDMHWLPRESEWRDIRIWRSNLLGGGRISEFLRQVSGSPERHRTLGELAVERGWDAGDGFKPAGSAESPNPQYPHGEPFLPTDGLSEKGIHKPIEKVNFTTFERARSRGRYASPLLLVKKHMDLHRARWNDGPLAYKSEIAGFPGKDDDNLLAEIDSWISREDIVIKAYIAGISIRLFNSKATAIALSDIMSIPIPRNYDLDLSWIDRIVADDIVSYQRDLVRLGEKSEALKSPGLPALPAFNEIFLTPINGIYTDNPLIAHQAQSWPGIICQPYSFGPATVDWSDVDKLRGRLDLLLNEQRNSRLSITRIARIYDGNMLFMIKPDRLRFWLRSVALRDADEVLADLRAQGF